MSYAILADILFVLVFFVFIAFGFNRGFIKSFVRSFSLLLSVAAAVLFGGILSDVLGDLFVDRWVYQGIFGTVEHVLSENEGGADLQAFFARIPNFLIGEGRRAELLALLENGAKERVTAHLSLALSRPVASVLSAVLGYGAVFFLSAFLLRLFARGGTALVEKIAPLGALNRFLGGVWGALAGSVCLLIVAFFIKLLVRDAEWYASSVIVKGFCNCAFLSFLNF